MVAWIALAVAVLSFVAYAILVVDHARLDDRVERTEGFMREYLRSQLSPEVRSQLDASVEAMYGKAKDKL